MAFPKTVLSFTVGTADVTPQGPLAAGTAGDDAATCLVFHLEAPVGDSIYRLEIVRGDGVYDMTEPLTPADDAVIRFDIPAAWTAAGTAAVRLVELTAEDGREVRRHYYPPVLLTFAYRDEGIPGDAPLCWQTMLTRAEAMLEAASAHAHDAAQITYDSSEQFLGGETVAEALNAASDCILQLSQGKAEYTHCHDADEIVYGGTLDAATVSEALERLAVSGGGGTGATTETSGNWTWQTWENGRAEAWAVLYSQDGRVSENGKRCSVVFTLPAAVAALFSYGTAVLAQYSEGVLMDAVVTSAYLSGTGELTVSVMTFDEEIYAYDFNVTVYLRK